jgi:ligand-binding sensor domain-containing protein
MRTGSPKRRERGTLSRELQPDDAAFQTDHGRVGAVFRAQFGQDVSDLTFHRLFAHGSQGTLWLSTQFTGLQRLDPQTGHFTIYRNHPGTGGSLSNDHVSATCIDTSGIIWIATQNGLNRFDPVTQSFTTYYERDGLPNNRVTGIHEDDRGNLWLSTRNDRGCAPRRSWPTISPWRYDR